MEVFLIEIKNGRSFIKRFLAYFMSYLVLLVSLLLL